MDDSCLNKQSNSVGMFFLGVFTGQAPHEDALICWTLAVSSILEKHSRVLEFLAKGIKQVGPSRWPKRRLGSEIWNVARFRNS